MGQLTSTPGVAETNKISLLGAAILLGREFKLLLHCLCLTILTSLDPVSQR
jgi:hypothetical protein